MTLDVASARAGVTAGQVDSFDLGSTDNWAFGQGVPQVLNTGGPAGAGDGYMILSSTGSGLGQSKLIVFNDNQWTGNYSAAGIGSIQMELMNSGSSPLTMRIALKTGFGHGPGWASTTGFALPADGLWHLATFPIDAADLTAVGAPPDLSSFLTNVGELRILDSASPAVDGDTIAASVGVDDITAVGSTIVPEPVGAGVILAISTFLLPRRR